MSIYDYQRLVGKISDVPLLRDKLILIYDTKSKQQLAQFGLLYAKHITDLTNINSPKELVDGLIAVQEWIDGETSYHKARNTSLTNLFNEAKINNDLIKKNYLKTMAQILCIPHVKAHGLWACDMAITLINALYPNKISKVEAERLFQINLLTETK